MSLIYLAETTNNEDVVMRRHGVSNAKLQAHLKLNTIVKVFACVLEDFHLNIIFAFHI